MPNVEIPDDASRVIDGVAFRERVAALLRAQPRSAPPALVRVELGGLAPWDPGCIALGRRLRAAVRVVDTIGWLGEAGYAVLLSGAQPSDAHRVASRLAASLGVPVRAVPLAHGEDCEAALRRATGEAGASLAAAD